MATSPALVEVAAFTTRLGRALDPGEMERAQAIIEDVSTLALGAAGAEWTAFDAPADVKAVVLSAALRQFKNPDRYVNETVGSYSATVHSSEFSSGAFTKAEMDVLLRNSPRQGFGLWGMMTIGRDSGEPEPTIEYWETNLPGAPVPYVERPY